MNRQEKTRDAVEERMQSANKGFLEGQQDIQEQGCSVKNKMATPGGSRACRFLL